MFSERDKHAKKSNVEPSSTLSPVRRCNAVTMKKANGDYRETNVNSVWVVRHQMLEAFWKVREIVNRKLLVQVRGEKVLVHRTVEVD